MISATIITLNEEEDIEKAIKSVKDLVDEIIVVDCGSKDKTVEIAEKLGAKVFFRRFDNFANQKNWAKNKAINPWILSLDADEVVTSDLALEIRRAVKNEEFTAFLIPRRNFILGREIKYSRWSPDRHIWLWKKDFGRWEGLVHEEVKVEGKVGIIENAKIHYSHQTIKEFIAANNRYSDLEAINLFNNRINFSFWKMIWEAIFEFLLRFVYKKGFMDGIRGFILAYLMGMYKLIVWIKLWYLKEQK